MKRKWRLLPAVPPEFVAEFGNGSKIIAQLLYNRNIDSQLLADCFFYPGFEKMHDPFLFKDMKKACDRIWRAIENGEKILIHGDYDADGVTSSAVLFKTLKVLGADVDVFIPHREIDGYGININNIDTFVSNKINLLVTVDCGITNVLEIKKLKDNGVDVIITDHHEPPSELPMADAILDHKVADSGYPFRSLSGAGVAYKLSQALCSFEDKVKMREKELLAYGGAPGFLKWILDIVAIGTVADVVPLIDENRILVKWGLIVLGKTRNIGLQNLLQAINTKKIDSYTIGFQIAPRLNAAGRINHASAAFELLVTEDPARAAQLADDLQKNNQTRQKLTEGAVNEAREQILAHENDKMFFAYNPDWQPGIVGLIAGRLCEEFYRPILAMTNINGHIVGSGRSIEEFHITNALHYAKHLLARYGGHAQACGFTIGSLDSLEEFKNILQQKATAALESFELAPNLDIDAEVDFNELSEPFLNQLDQLSPFGEGNDRPLFLLKNLLIASNDFLGDGGKHVRAMVKQGAFPKIRKIMGFNMSENWRAAVHIGDSIDVVAELGINEWNGNRELECKMVDWRKIT